MVRRNIHTGSFESLFHCRWCGYSFLSVSGRLGGGLDVEVVGGMFEVQKEREKASDWTSKRWRGTWKSKESEKKRWIGLRSGGEAHGSPKRVRKSGGLDFEAEGRHMEVQKEGEKVVDWTSKRRGGIWRSNKIKSVINEMKNVNILTIRYQNDIIQISTKTPKQYAQIIA